MEYVQLGKTGITVSRLCFGALVIGPLQKNMPVKEGAAVIRAALEMGVSFIDTAELYGTYGHIREALKGFGGDPSWRRSPMPTQPKARPKASKARKELDMDVLDIFLLHEQESRLTLKGHREALEYYLDEREKAGSGLSAYRHII